MTVPGKPRLEGEALERQRRPQQVAAEPLEAATFLGSNGHRIVRERIGGLLNYYHLEAA